MEKPTKKSTLIPPIDKLTSNNEHDAYDAFVNACYHPQDPDRAMRHLVREFRRVGITDKQISMFIRRAKIKGVPVPNPNTRSPEKKNLERVVLQADPKYFKYGQLHGYDLYGPTLQNLANKFGEFIYDKSFNDGVVGAFGKGQNIISSSREKLIVLRIPTYYRDQFKPEYKYRDLLITKIMNSMNHYRKAGGGDVEVEFYDP